MGEARGRGIGRLYVVATPIGNLGDTTTRAVETLRSVDAIAAEDTRRTRKLLSHFEIRTPLLAYHEHNEERAARGIVERLVRGDSIALVSDAGTPLVSDPGFRLVQLAIASGVEVVPIPGASSITAALSASGLPPQPFYFGGFLPRKSGARRRRLDEIADLSGTLVFCESPHRVAAALADAADVLGPRRAAIAREMTKVHEEFIRGTLLELADVASSGGLRGEMVLLIEGAGERPDRRERGARNPPGGSG
jgi:16S rRNA (cytidine1402-2'-O)-methyltransferase